MVANDPKRLGRPGAYRLGDLRPPGKPPPRLPAPHQPSFRPRPRRTPRSVVAWLAACAVVAALLGLAAGFGWWFGPFVVGAVAGAGPWRGRPALGLAVLAVLAGWGGALWWPALSGAPAGATAREVAALAGLPACAAAGVAVALLAGVAPVLAAFWLARAVTFRLR